MAISSAPFRTSFEKFYAINKGRSKSGEAVGGRGRSTSRTRDSDGFDRQLSEGETMRKKVFSAVLACGLFAAVSAATAYAQVPGGALRARIPFDFSVRGKTMPAGDYEIRRINEEPDSLVILSVSDKHAHAMFVTEPVQPRISPTRAELIFHRYGDSYFLSEIFGGDQTGRELRPSRQERDERRELASNQREPETIALAAY
jgi:hypothetical protein